MTSAFFISICRAFAGWGKSGFQKHGLLEHATLRKFIQSPAKMACADALRRRSALALAASAGLGAPNPDGAIRVRRRSA
jgi:hypothetical protein